MKQFIEKWLSERWTVGQYTPTKNFQKIKNHSCVCKPDKTLISLSGPADDIESQKLSDLISAAPDLYQSLKELVIVCEMTVGKRKDSLNSYYIKQINDALRAIEKAEGGWK